MSSSTSSSDWRRFFRLAAGTAVLAAGVIYAFVVMVDPFDTLPLSPPLDRVPVATNARFSFPALARSPAFDSAVFGTSTSRLLRPAALNPEFDAHFANLAMNDATAYEQSELMRVFAHAHPIAKFVLIGLDVRWCVTGDDYQRLTPRPFPQWMYGDSPWRGYAHMLNLYAVQEAGQQFGIMLGIKHEVYGRDGYTSFVPPDSAYDPARVAVHLRDAAPELPPGERDGDPRSWRFPALELLRTDLAQFAKVTRKVLYFVPYNHVLLSPDPQVWNECKRRAAQLDLPNTLVVDFMRPSPITLADDNYWDALHYRVAVADRIAQDLARAAQGQPSADYVVSNAP